MPLLDWQQNQGSLKSECKQVQLSKTIGLVNSYSDYQQMALELEAEKSKLAPLVL